MLLEPGILYYFPYILAIEGNKYVKILVKKLLFLWGNWVCHGCFDEKSLSLHWLVQSQHWKHQDSVKNQFKSNNKDIRTTSMTSYWYLCYYLWTDLTHCSGVSIVDRKQVNSGWDVPTFLFRKILVCEKWYIKSWLSSCFHSKIFKQFRVRTTEKLYKLIFSC